MSERTGLKVLHFDQQSPFLVKNRKTSICRYSLSRSLFKKLPIRLRLYAMYLNPESDLSDRFPFLVQVLLKNCLECMSNYPWISKRSLPGVVNKIFMGRMSSIYGFQEIRYIGVYPCYCNTTFLSHCVRSSSVRMISSLTI